MTDAAENQLKGVIFDLDGVLVTTDVFHYKAWKMLADELGLEFNEDINHQLRGVSRVESLKRIYRHNNRELPDEETFNAQMTKKNEKYKEAISTMKPEDVLPGSVELLKALLSKGIKCAIASASKNTPLVLKQTKLDQYVQAVADGNQITHSKPHPEVFLLAAQKLGVEPANCIGIEDAESGVEAIQRAEMVSIGIGSQGKKADMVVESVAELSADGMISFFNDIRG
ncbi:MAG: beta-phosphoglucomutase [Chitinivibrionales bacterium]